MNMNLYLGKCIWCECVVGRWGSLVRSSFGDWQGTNLIREIHSPAVKKGRFEGLELEDYGENVRQRKRQFFRRQM